MQAKTWRVVLCDDLSVVNVPETLTVTAEFANEVQIRLGEELLHDLFDGSFLMDVVGAERLRDALTAAITHAKDPCRICEGTT